MLLTFSPSFDLGSYPGPLTPGRTAAAGEDWLGPCGLLERLELTLGLATPSVSARMRAAALVPALRAREGFWSRSLEVDPLATARRLLFWRDGLALEGWRGDCGGPRLEALGCAVEGAAAGVPDRLRAVAEEIERRRARRVEIDAIELHEPLADLPGLWRGVLAALAATGVAARERGIEPAPARGDLAGARARPFVPSGDGSLTLLRSHGPLAAADEVAAWLAALPDLDGTVVVTPDAVLDVALRRHGLPTTGAPAEPEDCGPLAALPLVLAMGATPPDPRRAQELLALGGGPVPRSIGWRLEGALAEWPAVDSDHWRRALEEGLAAVDDPERRGRLRARLTAIFSPAERAVRYPAEAMLARLDLLEGWLAGRMAGDDADLGDAAGWRAARAQCKALRELLALLRPRDLARPELDRLVAEATAEAGAPSRFPAEAGLAAVGAPGAVAGPARRIVWWQFSRDRDAAAVELPLSREERAALEAAGVRLPDRGRAALARARRRRRPLLLAREALILVSPRRGAAGDEAFPHPLWDEVLAAMPDRALARRLESATAPPQPFLARPERPFRAPPAPRRAWRLAGAVPRRPEESPAGLGALLGCPLRWALERLARLAPSRALASGSLLLGKLAHEIVSRALAGPALPAPDAAERAAERVFDEDGPRLAAPLFLAGADAARADARLAIAAATRELARLIALSGRSIAGFEETRGRPALGARVAGRIDLLLAPAAVVDMKWGAGRWHRLELRSGTAHQLAIYAHILAADGAEPPPVAYFVLREQRLLTTDGHAFPGAEVVAGPQPAATWAALERAFEERRRELDDGTLDAPGNPDEDGETGPRDPLIVDGRILMPPGCMFCAQDGLCGRRFGDNA